MTTFSKRTRLPHRADAVFAWHERPGAFERLTPPWERLQVLEREGGIRDGARVVLEQRRGPVPLRWEIVHRDYEPGRQFADEQVSGPFAHWRHVHRFEPDGEGASVLEDAVEYRLPAGALGGTVAGGRVARDLERTFAFRHARTAADLDRHAAYATRPLRVAVTGATGLIGRSLTAFLTTGGHDVVRVTRAPAAAGDVRWDPGRGEIDAAALEAVDAVVHLAGESIAERWTDERKRAILESRRDGTALLARTLAALERPPRVLVSASGVGYYGSRGDEVLDESATPGTDFLARVCQAWEEAAEPAREAGIRVVSMRTGVVPASVLPRLRLPVQLALGGRLGSGRQWWSWVALDDVVGAYHHAVMTDGLSGPVNLAAPDPVTNADFVRTLARVLGRPAAVPAPATLLRIVAGELADALVLASQRVSSAKLEASGFRFLHRELEPALRAELGRS